MRFFKNISFNFQHLKCISSRTNSSLPKVALIGASGGIGQPLGLLLKQNSLISELSLYDLIGTPGVAADLSHINSKAKVTAYTGTTELEGALKNADIVIIPAGMPRKPGMTRDDLFNTNASIVRDIAEASSKICPKAFLAIITNPVNSTVPIAAEVYKKNNVYDSKRIFGVTTLDVVRSEAFNLEVSKITIPVVGGHSGITIIPLLSHVQPLVNFSITEIKNLTIRIQEAGTEVVKAKAGSGSATLSMAHAGARFVDALIKGLKGHNSLQYSYVASNIVNEVDYFASPVEVGQNGVEKIYPLGKLSPYEEQLIELAIPELKKNIENGVKFVKG